MSVHNVQNSEDQLFVKDSYLLEWKDIKYSVNQKDKETVILKGVSGYANSGEILAIMGTSGSGKTSLLSILSNRLFSQSHVKVSGKVTLNQNEIHTFHSNHYIKYVLQENFLFGTQTVRESLTFACRLKVPYLLKSQVNDRVNEIIDHLRLSAVADNMIGNTMRKGLSGGEKKRVSIGNELISYPNVLILDEPTSGLDSFTSQHLIEVLKAQAQLGRTIIFTIHQPNSKMFNMFDRFILMSEGSFLYQGPTSDAVKYFSDIGYQCPYEINPPEYFMRIFHIENRYNMTKTEREILDICSRQYKETLEQYMIPQIEGLTEIDIKKGLHSASIITELKVLVQRSILNVRRQPMLSAIKIVQAIIMASLVALIFNNSGHDRKSIQSITGALFFNSINYIAFPSQAEALTFPLERPVFLTEYKEDLYGIFPYFLTKVICEIPFQIIFTIIYSLIMYFAIPYNTYNASKFFVFFGISLLSQISGNSLGYLVGSLTSSIQLAVVIGPAMMVSLLAFGGFFSNTNSFSSAFYWVRYISNYNFTYRALIINQFTDFDFNDEVDNPIHLLNFEGEVWENAGALLLVTFGMMVIAVINLKISGEYHKRR
ncbi:hypothetical protein SteCoe_20610 [Stentor coeruleus]|uniref:ABC transporter domain-containing protein n=1 Tax=Stentor coeruleus TaxID=5963 RepID=A0A1R2BRK0_9CILI|nr:hypothetical protein SteCoe_20610 [Stentor coeruleus]